ncbi:MAG: hypothetical protein PVG51_10680 [Desulfosarcina sp.]|jgi:hypothetical protein
MTTDSPAAIIRTVGSPPVTDGRARFREIFCQLLLAESNDQSPIGDCEDFLFKLNDEPLSIEPPQPLPKLTTRFQILIVPGFLNECFASIALPFEEAIQSINDQLVESELIMVSGRSSSDVNAVYIAEKISELDLAVDEYLVIIGHSKGAVDTMHSLVNFPEASRRVSAVISVAGAINGTPLVDNLDEIYFNLAQNYLPSSCDEGDKGALNSLRPATRLSWMAANPLPGSTRYFSLATFSRREQINTLLKPGYDQLQIYSPRNDGILLSTDQLIPGSTLLGYANSDHWSVALPLDKKNRLISATIQAPNPFPRKILLQAMLLYVAEILETSNQ